MSHVPPRKSAEVKPMLIVLNEGLKVVADQGPQVPFSAHLALSTYCLNHAGSSDVGLVSNALNSAQVLSFSALTKASEVSHVPAHVAKNSHGLLAIAKVDHASEKFIHAIHGQKHL